MDNDDLIPKENMIFETLEEAEKFYQRYARLAGFETRKSTLKRTVKGESRMRAIVCSREGLSNRAKHGSMNEKQKKERAVPSIKCNCRAQIRFRLTKQKKYEVFKFIAQHSHSLVPPEDAYLMRSERNLNLEQQLMVHKASNINIGPVSTYKLCKELTGGCEHVGASKIDFKNFKRDIYRYIEASDAQMVVTKFTQKAENEKNFHFEYTTKEGGILDKMFWADEYAIANYIAFGDVISFDATYKKNKYNMVLVPFTGINNHKKCVSFGTGLISKEDAESYTWLLNVFLTTHGRMPIVVVTDQDPSMRQVVPVVFKESIHRFCMWHIMQKLQVKVGPALCNADSPFIPRLQNIVWNEHIEPHDFEKEWEEIIVEFNLKEHGWLSDIYDLRWQWVPAFFRNTPMSGLMKTTSLFEGQNSFFKHYLSKKSTLVDFFFRFDSALDFQKNVQRNLDFESKTKQLSLKTGLNMEKQASKLFTLKMFLMVQNEICRSAFRIIPLDCIKDNGRKTYTVKEIGENMEIKGNEQVVFEESDATVTCSCLKFERFGILCCHAYHVLRMNEVDLIPDKYILARWTKNIFTSSLVKLQHTVQGKEKTSTNRLENIEKMNSEFAYCVQILKDDDEGFENLMKRHHELMMELTAHCEKRAVSKKDMIETLVGMPQPDEIKIHAPQGIRNKGCGSSKRLRSEREKAIELNAKAPRMCKTCNKPGHHDSRNCPSKKGQSD